MAGTEDQPVGSGQQGGHLGGVAQLDSRRRTKQTSMSASWLPASGLSVSALSLRVEGIRHGPVVNRQAELGKARS